MVDEKKIANRGIYNNDYFSGAQVGIYIGDIFVDEVTSLTYGVSQERTPIYGYASTLFDAVSLGQVIVTGQFAINFKEAGYLWLVLQRYKALMKGHSSPFVYGSKPNEGEQIVKQTIEQAINGELKQDKRGKAIGGLTVQDYQWLASLSSEQVKDKLKTNKDETGSLLAASQSSLAGYSSSTRALNPAGKAENIFEMFENAVWGHGTGRGNFRDVQGNVVTGSVSGNRRCDDPDLNPFDIYVAFGDYTGDDNIHHTVQRISQVYIIGTSKQIVIDGTPVQEVYNFIARDII